MTRSHDAPSHAAYSSFCLEEAVIVDVNRTTWTVTADTKHSGRTVPDVQVISPYHHYDTGEGVHHLPEVGAICYLAWPSDNSPPLIMGYIGAPASESSPDGNPIRATNDGAGSHTDVSYRSKRPQLNPGDIAITTRDENFIYLRRGGIVQIGSTPLAQRIYIPILNYIKDFCENYEMHSFGGDVAWTVGREEHDPAGKAPASYVFHLNEFAQDAKATVRIRHLPLAAAGGGKKSAWEVHVSPQGIDRDTGDVSSATYSLVLTTDGTQTEVIGADRTVTVTGNDSLSVSGSRKVDVAGEDSLTAAAVTHIARGRAVLGGAVVQLGSQSAIHPAVLGDMLMTWFASAMWLPTAGPPIPIILDPTSLGRLATILSTKVTLE